MTQADRELYREILQALVDADWDRYSPEPDAIIVLTLHQFDLLYSCVLGKSKESPIELGHEINSEVLRHADTVQGMNKCGAYKEYDGMGCILPVGHGGNHLSPDLDD